MSWFLLCGYSLASLHLLFVLMFLPRLLFPLFPSTSGVSQMTSSGLGMTWTVFCFVGKTLPVSRRKKLTALPPIDTFYDEGFLEPEINETDGLELYPKQLSLYKSSYQNGNKYNSHAAYGKLIQPTVQHPLQTYALPQSDSYPTCLRFHWFNGSGFQEAVDAMV